LKSKYQNKPELNNDLIRFLIFYNLYRRHGSLRKELNVKTPFNAVQKWFELKPEIFLQKPDEFKNEIINLQTQIVDLHQQRCET
jgi:hypothetical protein